MTTLLKASCHCGLNTFSIPFNTDKLPFICHCNACRHSTGQLMVHALPFDGVPLTPDGDQPANLSNLTSYKSSNHAIRRFCSRCSCHMLLEFSNNITDSETSPPTTTTTRWYVAVGTLDKPESFSKIGFHIFISDTRDGGIANHLKVFNGFEIPRYAQNWKDGDVVPQDWKAAAAVDDVDSDQEYLPAYCHCKAISLWITRPSSVSFHPSSPYPDMMYPWKFTSETITSNPKDEKWWLRPAGATHPTRYFAGYCACVTCRLTSGFEIQSWAFIPRGNIFFRPSNSSGLTPGKEDELVNLDIRKDDGRPAGLKTYLSNPGRRREFCGTCGATVFWSGEERPDLVDLSIGLVDESRVGARAEEWFEWHGESISFEEDAINKSFVQAIAEGLKSRVY